jgi:hypothetical protein
MTGANARRPTNKAKRTDGTRRLTPPWTVEETDACLESRQHVAGARLFSRGSSGRRATAKPLTRDEARRIAANIAAGVTAEGQPITRTDAEFKELGTLLLPATQLGANDLAVETRGVTG